MLMEVPCTLRSMAAGEFSTQPINVCSSRKILTHAARDRQPPDGYRLSRVDFKNGQPLQPANSANPAVNILTNADNTKCPNDCFRPSGLAWDSKNRLYMASDLTGEVFVISGA
jgi:hypothetical protein